MCKCARRCVCCCCSCAWNILMMIICIAIVIAVAIGLGIYFGVVKEEDIKPNNIGNFEKTSDDIGDGLTKMIKALNKTIDNAKSNF